MFFDHPAKSTYAVIAGAVGGVTLPGVLSVVASVIAIVVGSLQLYQMYDRWQRKHKKGRRP